VRCVDDAIVERELQVGEKLVSFGRNFAERKTAGDGVVERLE